MARLQIPAYQIGVAHRGDGFRNLFQLFRLVRDRASTIHFGTVSAHVPRRISVCIAVVARALVAEIQSRDFPFSGCNSRVTKHIL